MLLRPSRPSQRRAIDQAIDHVLIIGLMAEAVDVRRIDGEFLDHVPVRRALVGKPPMPDLVDGKAGDFNCAPLAQDDAAAALDRSDVPAVVASMMPSAPFLNFSVATAVSSV